MGRPLRVAIVGSGPSGFYAAEALLKQSIPPVSVDMFDRLPTPYGLVRGGVAPDHQKIKSVIAVYEKIASAPAFRFFGNVLMGKDVSAEDLRGLYDQVVYAVGNESDRRLGVPGEDLKGSHSATSFVGWYNAHPDFREESFDLSVESAAVIGVGNVAMDVARILAEDPERLKPTDIAEEALEALRHSRVRTIYLLGRRGPAQAAFSPAEIQEIGALESADLVVDPREAALDEASKKDYQDPKNKKNVDYLQERAKAGEGAKPRKIRLRFRASPVEIVGRDGRVEAVKIERNRLVLDKDGRVKSEGTGIYESLPAGLVLRSVGYRGIPIPGAPFDEKSGHIPNAAGRVLQAAGTTAVRSGEYVVGWAKRGPTGLIGTNRADSIETVKMMAEDAAAGRFCPASSPDPDAVTALLQKRGVRHVSFADWKRLDALEIARGRERGKVRLKFADVSRMLSALS